MQTTPPCINDAIENKKKWDSTGVVQAFHPEALDLKGTGACFKSHESVKQRKLKSPFPLKTTLLVTKAHEYPFHA